MNFYQEKDGEATGITVMLVVTVSLGNSTWQLFYPPCFNPAWQILEYFMNHCPNSLGHSTTSVLFSPFH